MGYWMALAVCVMANISSNIAFKHVVMGVPDSFDWRSLSDVLSVALNPLLWLGFVLAGVVLASYLYAIRGVPLGLAYPAVTSLAVVGITLAGALLFGESVDFRSVAGMTLVVFGITLIAH